MNRTTGGVALAVATVFALLVTSLASAQTTAKKPNILIIWGDDIGYWNVSAYNQGMMGYKTPREGALFTDWYGQQSCTAGRAAFITGQSGFRTGMLKVGLPGAKEGLQKEDVTLAELLKAQGYVTGQFGKNHLGDRDEHLPTAHGFDEFFGSLYHLNGGWNTSSCSFRRSSMSDISWTRSRSSRHGRSPAVSPSTASSLRSRPELKVGASNRQLNCGKWRHERHAQARPHGAAFVVSDTKRSAGLHDRGHESRLADDTCEKGLKLDGYWHVIAWVCGGCDLRRCAGDHGALPLA